VTVLIVDDNAGVRRLLRNVAAEVATSIWESHDGADALAAYATHQPSVVLMDIRMPRMDGLAATRQIVAAYPAARVIMVTDYDDDALRQAAHESGACGYALKVNLLDLAALIRLVAF
jgi:CheY-like chemotaxis protein